MDVIVMFCAHQYQRLFMQHLKFSAVLFNSFDYISRYSSESFWHPAAVIGLLSGWPLFSLLTNYVYPKEDI